MKEFEKSLTEQLRTAAASAKRAHDSTNARVQKVEQDVAKVTDTADRSEQQTRDNISALAKELRNVRDLANKIEYTVTTVLASHVTQDQLASAVAGASRAWAARSHPFPTPPNHGSKSEEQLVATIELEARATNQRVTELILLTKDLHYPHAPGSLDVDEMLKWMKTHPDIPDSPKHKAPPAATARPPPKLGLFDIQNSYTPEFHGSPPPTEPTRTPKHVDTTDDDVDLFSSIPTGKGKAQFIIPKDDKQRHDVTIIQSQTQPIIVSSQTPTPKDTKRNVLHERFLSTDHPTPTTTGRPATSYKCSPTPFHGARIPTTRQQRKTTTTPSPSAYASACTLNERSHLRNAT